MLFLCIIVEIKRNLDGTDKVRYLLDTTIKNNAAI